jgi:hypothetical protein
LKLPGSSARNRPSFSPASSRSGLPCTSEHPLNAASRVRTLLPAPVFRRNRLFLSPSRRLSSLFPPCPRPPYSSTAASLLTLESVDAESFGATSVRAVISSSGAPLRCAFPLPSLAAAATADFRLFRAPSSETVSGLCVVVVVACDASRTRGDGRRLFFLLSKPRSETAICPSLLICFIAS